MFTELLAVPATTSPQVFFDPSRSIVQSTRDKNLKTAPDKAPEDLISLQDFLCGADGADPWCRQHFDDYIHDIDVHWDEEGMTTLKDGYCLAPSSDAMLLLKQRESTFDVVGYYATPGAVCIQDGHQGRGLGAELILTTYEWLGGPPTAGLDEQSFSKSGYAAHIAAWRLGVQRGLIIDPNAVPQQRRRRNEQDVEPGF